MAENSKISWTTHTFNPWVGCTRVSPGCENCYAENLMDRRYHKVQWGPGQPRSRTKTWGDPVRWNKQATSDPRPKVFCASLADWLDPEVPHQWREDLFALIDACPNLDWLMLTKRIENAPAMLPPDWWANPRPWVWLGATAENQKYWDIRVPQLAATPAALRWVSYEPSLGPIALTTETPREVAWVIAGGESEQHSPARPFALEWAESLIAQCRDRGIVPFMKQTGTNATWRGQPFPTKDRAGADPAEWPDAVMVQEFPAVAV